MSKYTKLIVAGAAIMVALVFIMQAKSGANNQSATVAGSTQQTITVGVALPFSGDGAVFGQKARKGIQLAAQDMPNVNVKFADTQGIAAQSSVTAVRKLMSTDDVDALIGPFGPQANLATAPITDKADLLSFAFSLCSPQYAEYEHLFCVYPSISEQLASVPSFLQNKGVSTMALVTEQSDYGQSSAKAIKNGRSAGDYEIAIEETVQPNTTDLRTIATKIINQSPDAVFVGSANVTQNLTLMQQLDELGYGDVRVAYIDTDETYLEDFGEHVDGVFVPGALGNDFSSSFTSKFESMHGESPDLYAAIAYDTLRYLYQSWQANGNSLRGIENQITQINYQNPAIDQFNFSADRTISFPTEIWQAQNSAYEPIQ